MKSVVRPVLLVLAIVSIIQIADSIGALSSGIGGRYWVLLFVSIAVLAASAYLWRRVSRKKTELTSEK